MSLADAAVEVIADFDQFDPEFTRKINRAVGAAAKEARAAGRALDDLGRTTDRVAANMNRTTVDAAGRMRDSMGRFVKSSERDLDGLGAKTARTFTGMTRNASQASNRMEGAFTGVGGRIGAGFGSMATVAAGAAAAIVGALTLITKTGLESAASLEQTRIGFTALLGSSSEADRFIGEVQQFAAKTPFEFPGLVDASQRFLAMGQAANISKDQILPVMTTLGDLSSVLGQGQQSIDAVVRAFGQMASTGKVNAQDMLQISSALPGFDAWGAMAKQLGVTTTELRKMSENGALPAQQGIAALLAGMKEFPGAAGAMAKQATTLTGLFSTFKDQARLALVEGFEPAIPAVKDALAKITPIVEDATARLAPSLGRLLGGLGDALGPMLDALSKILTPIIDGLAQGLSILSPALVPIGDALGQFAVALGPLIPDLADLLVALLPLAGPLIDLATALIPVVQWAADLATVVADTLVPVLTEVVEPIVKLFQALGLSAGKDLSTGLSTHTGDVQTSGKALGKAAGDGFLSGINQSLLDLGSMIGGMMSLLGEVMTDSKFWAAVFTSIGGTIKAGWTRLINDLGPVAGALFGPAALALKGGSTDPVPFDYKPDPELAKRLVDYGKKYFPDALAPKRTSTTGTRTGVPEPVRTDGAGLPKVGTVNPAAETEAQRKKRERELEAHRVAMEAAGAFLGDGFIEGLTSTAPKVKAAADKMASLLNRALGTKGARPIIAAMQGDTLLLRHIADQRVDVSKQLAKAQTRLDDLLTASARVREAIADKVRGSFNLVPEQGTRSVTSLLRQMDKAVATATNYTRDLVTLKGRGLADALLTQLAEAGPVQGAAMAAKLAHASAAQIAQLNTMSGKLEAAADGAGKTVSDALYASGIAAARGLVAGLKSEEAAIGATMIIIAKKMQAAIKAALGIKSPSAVMAGIGVQAMDGLRVGIAGQLPALGRTMGAVGAAVGARIAAPAIPGQRGPTDPATATGGPGGAGRSGPLFRDVNVMLPTGDPQAAAQAVVNRIAASV